MLFEIVPKDGTECLGFWRALIPARALLLGGIGAGPGAIERRLGLAAGVRGFDLRIAPDREAAKPAVEAVEDAEALGALVRDPQRQAGERGIEIFDPALRRRPNAIDEQVRQLLLHRLRLPGVTPG